MALENLYVPISASWFEAFRSERLSFPAGKHDDQVDALRLVGQLLNRMVKGRKPDPKDDRTIKVTQPTWNEHHALQARPRSGTMRASPTHRFSYLPRP